MNNNLWCINAEEERCIFVRLSVQFKSIYCMRELCVNQDDRNITAGMASHLNRAHPKMGNLCNQFPRQQSRRQYKLFFCSMA